MLTYNKIIIINFFLKNILSSKLKKKLNFKKQNELGKVIFIIDNTYYNKILINSSFKMTMPNQLGHTDNSNKDTSSRGTKRYKLLYVILFTLLCIIMLTYLFYFYLYSTDINNSILNEYVLDNYILTDEVVSEEVDVLKKFIKTSKLFFLF